jgi:hypothetical protein
VKAVKQLQHHNPHSIARRRLLLLVSSLLLLLVGVSCGGASSSSDEDAPDDLRSVQSRIFERAVEYQRLVETSVTTCMKREGFQYRERNVTTVNPFGDYLASLSESQRVDFLQEFGWGQINHDRLPSALREQIAVPFSEINSDPQRQAVLVDCRKSAVRAADSDPTSAQLKELQAQFEAFTKTSDFATNVRKYLACMKDRTGTAISDRESVPSIGFKLGAGDEADHRQAGLIAVADYLCAKSNNLPGVV